MGDPKRLRKLYERPMRLWDKDRIENENKLKEEYGLKNTREVWRAQTDLRKIRRDARRLLSLKGKKIEERTALIAELSPKIKAAIPKLPAIIRYKLSFTSFLLILPPNTYERDTLKRLSIVHYSNY